MSLWQQIAVAIITSGAITGLFQYILKTAIQHRFNTELLRMTKDLELKAQERNIKLAEVFKTQANVIETVFKNLLALRAATETFRMTSNLTPFQDREKALMDCITGLKNFENHFNPNEIYVPTEVAEKIKKFAKALRDIFINHHVIDQMEAHPKPTAMSERYMLERIDKVYQKVMEIELQIAPLLSELKKDFQQILGFPMSK